MWRKSVQEKLKEMHRQEQENSDSLDDLYIPEFDDSNEEILRDTLQQQKKRKRDISDDGDVKINKKRKIDKDGDVEMEGSSVETTIVGIGGPGIKPTLCECGDKDGTCLEWHGEDEYCRFKIDNSNKETMEQTMERFVPQNRSIDDRTIDDQSSTESTEEIQKNIQPIRLKRQDSESNIDMQESSCDNHILTKDRNRKIVLKKK